LREVGKLVAWSGWAQAAERQHRRGDHRGGGAKPKRAVDDLPQLAVELLDAGV